MPRLLVSVRSADEGSAAVRGGAAVIDVKEPSRGPLGRASFDVWESVRARVPRSIPVSVALGEVEDWGASAIGPPHWSGLVYRKVGFAASGPDWIVRWAELRKRLPGPPWVAVAYADWGEAEAPFPEEILDAALAVPDCVGLLIDSFNKARPSTLDESWFPLIARAKAAGRLVTLAGRIDAEAIRRLAPLGPDLFAVRGAACIDGDRLAPIDPARVASLARLVATVGVGYPARRTI